MAAHARQSLVQPGMTVASPAMSEASRAGLQLANPAARTLSALGNQAMQRLLHSRMIQAKLSVSTPGDQYEQEADRVADAVMRMSESPSMEGKAVAERGQNISVQRSCSGCEEEEKRIQPKSMSGVAPQAAADLDTEIDNLQDGRPLDASTRNFFEARLGHSFDRVQVHNDSQAGEMAQALRAEAFTVGNRIAMAPGRYDPGSDRGRRLLAHELTHVVQQGYAQPKQPVAARRASAQRAVMPYRSKGSANFGACDKPPLVEESFKRKDRESKPWIEKITVAFNGTATDTDGDLVPTGELTAVYSAKSSKKLADITSTIVGGKASQGLTDEGLHTVTRIEGCGYHHKGVPKAEQITSGHKRAFKYHKDTSKATMNFAVFFLELGDGQNQAIHQGSLSSGSLACVHVGTWNTIQQINYHSVENLTKVKVSYGASALAKVCCERFKTKKRMVSNPCKGQDSKKCP